MELKREELKKRAEALKTEILDFVKSEQTAIGEMQSEVQAKQTALQQRIGATQKRIDQMDGKHAGLLELIGPDEPAPGQPAPGKSKVIVPFPSPAEIAGANKSDEPKAP